MNTKDILAAIDEVRHDVDAWDHDPIMHTYTKVLEPFTLRVRRLGNSWWYEVVHEAEGTLAVLPADTAAEGRRLALDYTELRLNEYANA